MARVAVVTDSTAALPAASPLAADVRIVPLQVVLDGCVGAEGIDVSPGDVAAALAARASVSTSRPSPEAFTRAYAAAAASGATGVVSVHLSRDLSGTIDAARLAVPNAPIPVAIVDSRSTAMGLGFPVLAAAAAAGAGADVDVVASAATDATRRTRTLFYVDSLDALRRGGRIGQAAAVVGAALLVKPLLEVLDGRIALLEKVRTASKALARLQDVALAGCGDDAVDVAVHHLGAESRALTFADALRSRLPELRDLHVSEVGAVVGAHVGLGLLGVVVHRRAA